uniref:COG3624 Uncharacterized enzyme of phosphonate metabolism n=1 Tax=uncultured bacterium B3TF_MPn1 TaxID=1439866 RepID=W0NQF2_9BACT|nr:COG3624 Uncharacterized enzyme of phosphonate metabolism [uncultured bacterium B3TF_MPn1]
MNSESSSGKTSRQRLLSLLSKSNGESVKQAWESLGVVPEYSFLKRPEVGMVMVKAQAGGNGTNFNMGEMTVTRTVLQLSGNQVGYGYIAGRDKDKSLTVALIDALYQLCEWQDVIEEKIMKPLERALQSAQTKHKQRVDRTKVNFFTMVRGE